MILVLFFNMAIQHNFSVCIKVALCLSTSSNPSDMSIHLGHEKSADFGNNVFLANGLEVNHQYDKSSAYVQLAKEHVQRDVMAELKIVTPLAEMYEIDVCLHCMLAHQLLLLLVFMSVSNHHLIMLDYR